MIARMETTGRPATRLDGQALARAVDGSLFDLFRSMRALPGAELVERDTLALHHAFPGNPMFKGVWAPRLAPDEADEAIVEALGWHAARGAPFAFWWTGPGATPGDLGGRLEAHGLVAWERDAPGMAAELDVLDWSARARVPDGYREDVARTPGDLEAFATVFTRSFGVPVWAAQGWIDATLALGIGRAPWAMVVGRLGGEPVATAIVSPGAGVASVFGVGVVPEARERGLGASITLAGYELLREQGYRYGVLFATPEGLPVYERLGFRRVEAAISRWLWRRP